MTEQIKAPIGNYYGTPFVDEEDGKYLFCLENWDGFNIVEVSKEFYEAWKKEFNKEQFRKDKI